MKASDGELITQVKGHCDELSKREKRHKLVDPYYEGSCPLPAAISTARMTKAYRYLMPMAETTWGSLIVDTVLDRLEVTGFKDTDQAKADAVWNVWQANQMDSESTLTHTSSLIDGRAFAWIWPGEDGEPEISIDTSSQMVVDYAPGFIGRKRVSALRRWVEDGVPYAKLFRREGIYKFKGPKDYGWGSGIVWEQLPDEYIENSYDVVPVVELAVNRRLKPESGTFGFARGEYEHVMALIDRINLLTFLGLVVALWMGFPLRGVTGNPINRRVLVDDNGDPLLDTSGNERTEAIPPFDQHADSTFQLESPEAKIVSYDAADRGNLSVFDELAHLAMLTKTPRHYFPQKAGISNVSADTIRAEEGGLHAKVNGKHKPFLGEGWLDVGRVVALMQGNPLSPVAQVEWADVESRSLAERADAWSKLTDLPWAARAELALNAGSDQINRWAAERANDPLSILAQAVTAPPPVPAMNGGR